MKIQPTLDLGDGVTKTRCTRDSVGFRSCNYYSYHNDYCLIFKHYFQTCYPKRLAACRKSQKGEKG